jgi:drug/metabolite transporter (DMT)-like permease
VRRHTHHADIQKNHFTFSSLAAVSPTKLKSANPNIHVVFANATVGAFAATENDVYSSVTSDCEESDRSYLEQCLLLEQQQQQRDFVVSSVLAEGKDAASTDIMLADTNAEITNQSEEQKQQRAIFVARLLLFGAAALYGTNFSCVKLLDATELPIGLSSTLRFALAALATSPWLFLTNKHHQESSKTVDGSELSVADVVPEFWKTSEWGALVAGLEVGFWNSFGYVAQAVGLEATLASKSAFLCSLAVVTVPILDWLTGKKLKPREMLGIVLALLGVGFLELGGENPAELLKLSSSDIASLMQPIFFGLGFWRMEKAMHKYPDQANRSTAAQLLAIFMVSAVFAAVTEPSVFTDFSSSLQFLANPWIIAALFWTGCITTALTVYMETVALKTLSAAETTLIFSTEPLWGSAFAALVMGETFGWDAAVGGFLIVAGCIYSNLGWDGIQKVLFKKTQATKNQAISHTE